MEKSGKLKLKDIKETENEEEIRGGRRSESFFLAQCRRLVAKRIKVDFNGKVN